MAEVDDSYKELYQQLSENRSKIVEEHLGVQGKPQDVGGYFKFDFEKASKAMRPSTTMNKIFDN
jgi:isocitrate dehydrogenase